MSAGFKHTAVRVITSNRHMAAMAIKGLSMFYLVRNEASYQCFEGSLYGVVCFYNKCALIKVALEVSIDGIVFPTNFATLKIRFIPCRVKHISATNQ